MSRLDALSRELIIRNKLIEAGFILRILPLADAADPERAEAMRHAFVNQLKDGALNITLMGKATSVEET